MTQDDSKKKNKGHIVLTSHPARHNVAPLNVQWGKADPKERGPVIASLTNTRHRNVIGTHSGFYSVYRALAVAAGLLDPEHVPDLSNTTPPADIGPHAQWSTPGKIISLDPWGHLVANVFADEIQAGYDIRPTIAVTRAHINLPDLHVAMQKGRLKADGKILSENGDVVVTKAAIEPVWYLPGIAERFQVSESVLRRTLFEQTAGMFPELVTRRDLDVFLPPIGGLTAYFFGDVTTIHKPEIELTCRIHDECNGSDVFGSDICTCRPYLVHAIELCIESAQKGGAGLIVYNRKEGRGLGEVTKFLVYNARKRQKGGDTAAKYFERTECVAGVQDMRFQEIMSDILHWLGITKIHRFVSMSNVKYEAIVRAGIHIDERIQIPDELIPSDAQVEIDAKRAAGYYSTDGIIDINELAKPKGRALHE
ncbi:GTP cyclohydrolase II [Legionella waltersii]|uniref:GTP cyclohydrolase II n=1 Tax=Legionella waltersii TaxID=66969 RepID=A0A0W1A000_9GAMM|nr:GTP cyclohydrolase II [Legionella waltersii]KTD74671.1 GTP cyclohydrolase II [Legionella waltersii]SNV09147.1 GTP cyclohydrolase II [Legionella waltersii]